MDILDKIETKIINLIDINEKLIQKIQQLTALEAELKRKNAQLHEDKTEIHHRLEKLFLTINEVEDVMHNASHHQESIELEQKFELSHSDNC